MKTNITIIVRFEVSTAVTMMIICYCLLSQTILVTLNESKTVEAIQILPKYQTEESNFDLMQI
jgi:hypothetical protein